MSDFLDIYVEFVSKNHVEGCHEVHLRFYWHCNFESKRKKMGKCAVFSQENDKSHTNAQHVMGNLCSLLWRLVATPAVGKRPKKKKKELAVEDAISQFVMLRCGLKNHFCSRLQNPPLGAMILGDHKKFCGKCYVDLKKMVSMLFFCCCDNENYVLIERK